MRSKFRKDSPTFCRSKREKFVTRKRSRGMQIDAVYHYVVHSMFLDNATTLRKANFAFIGAHARPQLYRFLLTRFVAVRIPEISEMPHIRRPSSLFRCSSSCSTSFTTAPRDLAPWFFLVSPLLSFSFAAVSVTAHIGSVLYSARASTRGKRAAKENVSSRHGWILSRVHHLFPRQSFSMVKKSGINMLCAINVIRWKYISYTIITTSRLRRQQNVREISAFLIVSFSIAHCSQ